jgi:hypothetical protein
MASTILTMTDVPADGVWACACVEIIEMGRNIAMEVGLKDAESSDRHMDSSPRQMLLGGPLDDAIIRLAGRLAKNKLAYSTWIATPDLPSRRLPDARGRTRFPNLRASPGSSSLVLNR